MSSWLWLLLAACLFAPNLAEIAERAQLDHAELRVLSVSGIPRLLMSDADGGVSPALEQAAQAARNVLGRFSVVQIRAGRLRASSARRL